MITLLSFIDISSLAFVAGSSLLPVVSTRGVQDGQLQEGLQRVVLSAGILGSLFGFILMLAQMDDPSTIWSSMWVASLGSIYALCTYAFLKILPQNRNFSQAIAKPSRLGSTLVLMTFFGVFVHYGQSMWIDIPATFIIVVGVGLSTFICKSLNKNTPTSYYIVQNSAIVSILSLLYSYVFIYFHLADPTMIGPAMATGLLSTMYAAILMGGAALVIPSKYLKTVQRIQVGFLLFVTTGAWLLFAFIMNHFGA